MPITASAEARAIFMQGLAKSENLEDGTAFFDEAVQKDPNFAFAYLFAGRTNLDAQRNLAKAVSLADKVSPAEREWILASAAQTQGDAAGATAHYQNLLKLMPGDKRVQSQLGVFYRNLNDQATSLTHFQQSVKIDAKYAPAYNNLGYTYMAMGRYPDAEKAFKRYIELIPNNPNPYDSYAEMLLNSGKHDESIKQYNMALAKDPTFYASYRGIANNYVYKGDYAKAREVYNTMLEKTADNPQLHDQALSSLTNAYISEGNFSEALKVNEQRIAIAQKLGDAQSQYGLHNLSAFIATEAGNLDAAAEHWGMASKLMSDPSIPARLEANRQFGAGLTQARLLAAKGDAVGARSQLDSLAKVVAGNQNVNQTRTYSFAEGYAAIKQKQYAKATEFLAKANQADPYTWYYQAVALEGSGDTAGAAKLYKKVAGWDQLDNTGYAFARRWAMAKTTK